jgi:hypothetical protein
VHLLRPSPIHPRNPLQRTGLDDGTRVRGDTGPQVGALLRDTAKVSDVLRDGNHGVLRSRSAGRDERLRWCEGTR